ncbi:MAG: hypothetical protein QGH60_08765 [Phycisphaerae bacterium]|jgi:hypothetical protein|nr:hypothetical protein [Phycisphaerae bacterium]
MRRVSLALIVLIAIVARTSAADPAPGGAKGTPLPAKWTYSKDGGKTFSDKAPMVSPTRTPLPKDAVTARATFTIDDPAKVGALKLITHGDQGAITLTTARSVDRYNVGSRPVLTEAKLAINGKTTTSGHLPYTLYRYLTIDPALLKKGANTLTVSGIFWFSYTKDPLPASLRLETISADLAMLDRHPVLGPVGPDHFAFAARAVIPSTFSVTTEPLDPPGDTTLVEFPRSRVLKARIPLPTGTKRFRYRLTVKAGRAAKEYGPYDVAVPVFGEGFRFMVAGGTWVYKAPTLQKWFKVVAREKPQIYIHTGNFQNCRAWDWMWTRDFLSQGRTALSHIPLYPVCSVREMLSPISFSRTFYFPPDDKDFGHWTTVIGKVRFVAIEAFSQSQAKDPPAAAAWLDGILKEAKEDYVIVLNHHLSGCGKARRSSRLGVAHTEKHIDPLLVKHKVTATIGGLFAIYARIEPAPGKRVPTIIVGRSGGLGRQTRQVKNVQDLPHCKIATRDGHYCIFEVKKNSLVMKVFDLDGKPIDQHTFTPRKP